MNEFPEAEKFKKIEALLGSRGLEFTPPMRFNYFNDPMFKALFTLILELFEDRENRLSNWDPWEDF